MALANPVSLTMGAQRWREVDLQARSWVVPAERMKGGEPHFVDESAYENHAQFLLGIPGADPLA